jgi:peptide chain release factor 2
VKPNFGGIFDFDKKSEKLEQVNQELEDPAIWNDQKRALEMGKEKKALEGVVLTLEKARADLGDANDLFEMAREEGDDDTIESVEGDAEVIKKVVEAMEFRRMFSNPMDHANCFIDIQAGAGGTEAQDWASMLLRQYLRYCERKGFKAEVMEISDGEVAGIKTATVKVEGEYAYGHLRTETGVHRLVRKSPFDSANGRHTSFTSLFVYPEVDESFEIEINPADVRIDTYRAAHQQDRLRRAPDARPFRYRGPVPERPLAAPQQGRSLRHAARQAVRARDAQAHERAAETGRFQDRRRLGPPDPFVCAGPVAHQGLAHRLRDRQYQERAGR